MTALMSAAMDESSPWPQRWAVRLHILYCTSCRRYRRQMLALRLVLRALGATLRGSDTSIGPALSAEARNRIGRALRKP